MKLILSVKLVFRPSFITEGQLFKTLALERVKGKKEERKIGAGADLANWQCVPQFSSGAHCAPKFFSEVPWELFGTH